MIAIAFNLIFGSSKDEQQQFVSKDGVKRIVSEG